MQPAQAAAPQAQDTEALEEVTNSRLNPNSSSKLELKADDPTPDCSDPGDWTQKPLPKYLARTVGGYSLWRIYFLSSFFGLTLQNNLGLLILIQSSSYMPRGTIVGSFGGVLTSTPSAVATYILLHIAIVGGRDAIFRNTFHVPSERMYSVCMVFAIR